MFNNSILKGVLWGLIVLVVALGLWQLRHEQFGLFNEQKEESISPKLTQAMDSIMRDSLQQQDLYRKEQAAVNIDMEDHTEPVYFTVEDVKAWSSVVQSTYEKIKK